MMGGYGVKGPNSGLYTTKREEARVCTTTKTVHDRKNVIEETEAGVN
jgi:hypothetical protein